MDKLTLRPWLLSPCLSVPLPSSLALWLVAQLQKQMLLPMKRRLLLCVLSCLFPSAYGAELLWLDALRLCSPPPAAVHIL